MPKKRGKEDCLEELKSTKTLRKKDKIEGLKFKSFVTGM